MKLNFTWKRKTGRYQTGENLYINKICVGHFDFNGMMSRGESAEYKKAHRYVGSCFLPDFSIQRIYGATAEAIKNTIETMVTKWFNEIFNDTIKK